VKIVVPLFALTADLSIISQIVVKHFFASSPFRVSGSEKIIPDATVLKMCEWQHEQGR